jgi:hypothetical protein
VYTSLGCEISTDKLGAYERRITVKLVAGPSNKWVQLMSPNATNPGTQAEIFRSLLAQRCAPGAILEKGRMVFPKAKSTFGYINWVTKKSEGVRI